MRLFQDWHQAFLERPMVQATGRREVRLASVALGRARRSGAQSRHREERYDVLLPFIPQGPETPLETPTRERAQ